jgi:hypothetical protein
MAAGLPNLKVSRRVECAWRLLLEHTCVVFHFFFVGIEPCPVEFCLVLVDFVTPGGIGLSKKAS